MKSGRIKAPKQTSARKASVNRVYVSQGDVPSRSLDQALRIARAIADNFAYHPTSPLQLASALGVQPDSGSFRQMCGAAIAYGLTKGGSYSHEISLDELGLRIVRPLNEGDDLRARREALLRPRVIGEFLRKYDRAKFPREEIAKNILQDMGVPPERTASTFELIVDGAKSTGIIQQINGTPYIDLAGAGSSQQSTPETDIQATPPIEPLQAPPIAESDGANSQSISTTPPNTNTDSSHRKRRVFIAHGKNKAFVDPIKKLLGFGEMEAVISTERETVSIPVPDKVMADMRSCGAAIIHIEDELKLKDPDGVEHVVPNPNVLIEIGAAMALYGRRFILLVKSGVESPSNLQGLYEVRYTGDNLDGEATLKLLEAIRDIKNHPLPTINGNKKEGDTTD